MDIVLSNLPPSATEVAYVLGAAGEPYKAQRELPPNPLIAAVAAQQATIADVPDGTEGLAFVKAGTALLEVRNFMAGFTRQIPRLDALVPDTMASASGRQLLEVHGRGLSISNELFFGTAGVREPVRPDMERKVITTYIETDLWAPGPQPVWVVNAGTKSNVLTFTFT